MYYTSANRDEDVFDDPQRFDIHRHPNPHLSFGIAEHFCLGVHLARLEGRVFFEELLDDVPDHRADRRPRAHPLEPQQRAEAPARPPGGVSRSTQPASRSPVPASKRCTRSARTSTVTASPCAGALSQPRHGGRLDDRGQPVCARPHDEHVTRPQQFDDLHAAVTIR